MSNKNLHSAKKAENDEFYTQYKDIEREITTYWEYNHDVFNNKTILLPCDDYNFSQFTRYFCDNFTKFGLKRLISTAYKAGENGLCFEKTCDNETAKYLRGDGDFRSVEIKALRDEADFIITNPPFSLFREFLAWIVEAGKQFLIIGNMNAITYKEVFPFIKENKLWLGNGFHAGNAYFSTPFASEYAEGVYNPETGLVKFGNVCWFTNIDHGRSHQPLPLMTMEDNLRFSKHKEIKGKTSYERYDNYDAIEVPFTDAIPSDYDGVMGVPISFLDKYCPEQFEIVGLIAGNIRGLAGIPTKTGKDGPYINGKLKYGRALIKHRGLPK